MTNSAEAENQDPFRLSSGGALHRLLTSSRWTRGWAHSRGRSALVAVLATWGGLFVLNALEAALTAEELTPAFLEDPLPYGRLLVALPLLILAGAVVDGSTRMVIRYLKAAGVVPKEEHARFDEALQRLTRRRDAGWVDVLTVALALGLSAWIIFFSRIGPRHEAFPTWVVPVPGSGEPSLAGWWNLVLCLPLFQILVFRCLYRFGIWAMFLWRVSRLKLHLEPTHPDLAGGLGIVAMGQNAFVVIFVALGAVMSSVLARDILQGESSVAESKHVVVGFIVLGVVALLAPLVVFAKALLKSKRGGLLRYGLLAQRLSGEFSRRWIDGEAGDAEKLIDTADPSTIADYGTDYETVRRIRILMASPRSALTLAVILVVPFLPLALTHNSVRDLLDSLSGILM